MRVSSFLSGVLNCVLLVHGADTFGQAQESPVMPTAKPVTSDKVVGFFEGTRQILKTGEIASLSLQVPFEPHSATLTQVGKTMLAPIGEALKDPALVDSRFVIEVHTEAMENAGASQSLSCQQAESVKSYLTGMFSIEPSRLITAGKGSTEPVNRGNPSAPENRRVNLYESTHVDSRKGKDWCPQPRSGQSRH